MQLKWLCTLLYDHATVYFIILSLMAVGIICTDSCNAAWACLCVSELVRSSRCVHIVLVSLSRTGQRSLQARLVCFAGKQDPATSRKVRKSQDGTWALSGE